jgi:hypothetical protein
MIGMKARNFKRIWGKPWDFGYLLKLEQYKIREISKFISKQRNFVNWKSCIRDLKLCDKLISIVLEEDNVNKGYLNKYTTFKIKTTKNDKGTYTLDTSDWVTPTFDHYVNIKNAKRFNVDIIPRLIEHQKVDLRITKALYLYNKIRSYKMFNWWL